MLSDYGVTVTHFFCDKSVFLSCVTGKDILQSGGVKKANRMFQKRREAKWRHPPSLSIWQKPDADRFSLMIDDATNIYNGNGHVHMLDCPSDYEPRPAIDIVPSKPSPKWRDQLAPYTHSLSWSDSDGCQHALTLRSDSLSDLMVDLKLLKGMIRASKARATVVASHPESPTEMGDVPVCKIHGVQMERRVSKRTSGHYRRRQPIVINLATVIKLGQKHASYTI
jgi:hypothetical protein